MVLMIDWLNIKAALSICTVILIATAGAHFASESDKIKQEKFEAMLEEFVSTIDNIFISSAFISVNITSEMKENENSIYFDPLFDNEHYTIVITENKAVFRQDNLICSKDFVNTIFIVKSGDYYEPGSIIDEDDLEKASFIKTDAGLEICVVKLIVNSAGVNAPKVILVPDATV